MLKYFPVVRTNYASSNALQQRMSRKLLDFKNSGQGKMYEIRPPPMALLAYELDPTYTLGRRQRGTAATDIYRTLQPIVKAKGAKIFETLRGGHTTFHGPGQLVLYPVLDLQKLNIKVREYVCILEKAIVSVLREKYSIDSEQRPGSGYNGVWIKQQPKKIASVGVHVRRNVTSHGLAINVDMDPFWFQQINACNLPDIQMVSINDLNPASGASVSEVGQQLAEEITKRLGLELEYETVNNHKCLLESPESII